MQKTQAPQTLKQVPWNLRHFSTTVIATGILLFLLIAGISQLPFSFVEGNATGISFLILVQNAAFLIPIYFLAIRPAKATLADLGFNKTSAKQVIGYTLLGFLIFITFSLLINWLQTSFNIQIPGFGEQMQRLPLFGDGSLNTAIAFLVIVIAAPILEEIIFRSFVYQTMAKYLAKWPAIIAGGFIFAASHLEPNVILPLWFLGSIICWIFSRTNSIWPAISFHIFNNALAFFVEFYLAQTANS